MRWKEANGLKWLEFDIFARLPLVHAVFARQGGVSLPPFDSLNVGYQVGDRDEDVNENISRIQTAFSLSHLFFVNQVHAVNLIDVNCVQVDQRPTADGLIATQVGKAIAITHADCQAAIFYDPICHVVAVVHCGWRGSVQNIYRHTVERLCLEYGCRPERLLVGISPSLGPLSAQFINYESELPPSFYKYQAAPFYFDFYKISQEQLLACGLQADHIEIASLDTFSTSQDFFSYRRDKCCGRHATLAVLDCK